VHGALKDPPQNANRCSDPRRGVGAAGPLERSRTPDQQLADHAQRGSGRVILDELQVCITTGVVVIAEEDR
jgi:hypothetical protein